MLSNRFAEAYHAFTHLYLVNLVRPLRSLAEPLTSLSERC